ncbi:MAG: hypothetical protein Q9226_005099 [Calogaya cf. arnoldii]
MCGPRCSCTRPVEVADALFPYYCDPPSKYNDDWPVDPKYLFEHYYNTDADDVMWSYDNEYRNNNKDTSQSNPGDGVGQDAYGFVMLDGPPGSLDSQFSDTHTITRRTVEVPTVKRSILTSNSSIIDSTFEHSGGTVYVYCNHAQDSAECQKMWYKGAEDTIIKPPSHVGEGPYARVVSMDVAEPEYQLPLHHLEARSLDGMRLFFMRVDYTNLLGYWDDINDEPANKKRKRDAYSDHLSQDQWRSKIGKTKRKHETLRKRQTTGAHDTTTTELSNDDRPVEKRWFGRFLDWLSRLNVVENLYGEVRLTLYHLYEEQYSPMLQIRGVVTLKGEMRAGAKVNFGKAEVYWPQDDTASDVYQTLLGLNTETSAPNKDLIAPTFDAKVRVDATLDINVTPEANMGLRVGGKISGGTPLVDAQLVGYVNSTLRFRAAGAASGGTTNTGTASYRYGVYLLFNLGYGAYASIKFFSNWASKPRNAFDRPKQFTIYENSGSFSGPTKRALDALEAVPAPKFHEGDSSAIGTAQSHRRSTRLITRILMMVRHLADDDGLPDAANAATTAQLQCAGNTPDIRLPDLRLNCNTFAPLQVNPTGGPAGNFASLAGAYVTSQRTLGWKYKHNFTHGLAQPQNTGDGDPRDLGTNRAESWTDVNPQIGTGFSGNNMDQIACAVHIFGQDEVSKTGFNGYCYNGESRRGNGTS